MMKAVAEMARRGWTYDWAVIFDGNLGGKLTPRIGCDYYQNLMLWSLPAALAGGNLNEPCKSGGLVDRIVKAGMVK